MVVKIISFNFKKFQFLKAEFLFFVLSTSVEILANFVFLYYLLGDFLALNDDAILLVFGFHRVILGVARMLYLQPLLQLPGRYRSDQLDKYLLAPVNTQFYYFIDGFSFFNLLNVMVGLGFIGYAMGIHTLTLTRILIVLFLLINANVLMFSTFNALACFLAYKINSGPLNALYVNLFALSQFKPSAFPVPLATLLGFFIPSGLVIWMPLEWLAKPNIYSLLYLIFMTLIVCALSQFSWHNLIKRYQSAN